ncbi:MAG: 3-hydroxyacyl-ACP dehydratase [Rhizobacter sp.]|nr:3-hydroxyacyl-ACP dehydratase [Rhizobacter sp.]
MSETVASARIEIGAEHPAFAGHFPGRPLLPGVALLAAVLEAVAAEPCLAAAVGAAPRLASVKFLAPVGPRTSLAISLRLGETAIDWQVDAHGAAVATGRIVRADAGAAEPVR